MIRCGVYARKIYRKLKMLKEGSFSPPKHFFEQCLGALKGQGCPLFIWAFSDNPLDRGTPLLSRTSIHPQPTQVSHTTRTPLPTHPIPLPSPPKPRNLFQDTSNHNTTGASSGSTSLTSSPCSSGTPLNPLNPSVKAIASNPLPFPSNRTLFFKPAPIPPHTHPPPPHHQICTHGNSLYAMRDLHCMHIYTRVPSARTIAAMSYELKTSTHCTCLLLYNHP